MIALGSTVILKSGVDGRIVGRCEYGSEHVDSYDVQTRDRMHPYLSPEFFTVVADPPEGWGPIILTDLEDEP